VKGFLSLKPLACTHVPLDVTISKLCEEFMFGIVFAKFMFYFGEELGTFGYAVDVFPTEI
jgi:hypothetical protein